MDAETPAFQNLIDRWKAEREAADHRDQESVSHLGLAVKRNGHHVMLLEGGRPVYHWYPTKGSLYAGASPDERIEGRFDSLEGVAGAVETHRRAR